MNLRALFHFPVRPKPRPFDNLGIQEINHLRGEVRSGRITIPAAVDTECSDYRDRKFYVQGFVDAWMFCGIQCEGSAYYAGYDAGCKAFSREVDRLLGSKD